MKKIITVLAALAVTTVSAFAGPAISVGGGVGGAVNQQEKILVEDFTWKSGGFESGSTTSIVVTPVISVKGDFQWEKIGFAVDFDFNMVSKNNWDCGYENDETIYVNPYINLNAGDFNFNIGPLVGMRFTQAVINDSDSNYYTFVLFGGSVNCNYNITEKLKAYIELPFISNNMLVNATEKRGDHTDHPGLMYYKANLEVVPKFGLMFTF